MSNTITQYMVAADAEPDSDFSGHLVGVDSAVGLHVITSTGEELNFDPAVQGDILEALKEWFYTHVE